MFSGSPGKPTQNLQVVCVADAGLHRLAVVLQPGHTLQVALVVRFDHEGEDAGLPGQRGVVAQRLVLVAPPEKPSRVTRLNPANPFSAASHSLKNLQQHSFILRLVLQLTLEHGDLFHHSLRRTRQNWSPQKRLICWEQAQTVRTLKAHSGWFW